MKLVIDDASIAKIWSGNGDSYFSMLDYTIHPAHEFEDAESVELIKNGFIPFLSITDKELITAYISTLNNQKVSDALSKLDGAEFVDTFWKYYNVYDSISSGFESFEKKYAKDKLIAWCDENSIEYSENND